MATKIGKTYLLREVSSANFQALAKDLALAPDIVIERVRRLCEATHNEVGAVRDRARAQGLSSTFLDALTKLIAARAEACRQSMERSRALYAAAPPRVVAVSAPPDPREYIFQSMRVVGNRLVAELSAMPGGERVLLDPYRPGRASAKEGDRVRLAAHQSLVVVARGPDRGRAR
jgi:hypothetical protein